MDYGGEREVTNSHTKMDLSDLGDSGGTEPTPFDLSSLTANSPMNQPLSFAATLAAATNTNSDVSSTTNDESKSESYSSALKSSTISKTGDTVFTSGGSNQGPKTESLDKANKKALDSSTAVHGGVKRNRDEAFTDSETSSKDTSDLSESESTTTESSSKASASSTSKKEKKANKKPKKKKSKKDKKSKKEKRDKEVPKKKKKKSKRVLDYRRKLRLERDPNYVKIRTKETPSASTTFVGPLPVGHTSFEMNIQPAPSNLVGPLPAGQTFEINIPSARSINPPGPFPLRTTAERQNELLADIRKHIKPMTQEQYLADQSVIRRVYDELSGRTRLIRGEGEVLEEIVSKSQQKSINKNATAADGAIFQANLRKP